MNYKQLASGERYQIKAYLKIGLTLKAIATHLGRNASTISREIKRNTGLKGYRPKQANQRALSRRHNALKAIKLTPSIRAKIEQLIRQDLSPEQVCHYLKKQGVLVKQQVTVGASIGVTFYPQNRTVDAERLIQQADEAMYHAKQAGKNRYQLFDPEQTPALGQTQTAKSV